MIPPVTLQHREVNHTGFLAIPFTCTFYLRVLRVRSKKCPVFSLYRYRLLPALYHKRTFELAQGFFWHNPSRLLIATDDAFSPGVDGSLGAVCKV